MKRSEWRHRASNRYPGRSYLDAHVWQVDIEGEYLRFEIVAPSGTASSTTTDGT